MSTNDLNYPLATLVAGCKVNIFLRILGRRDDGYHDLATLFLPLPSPHDVITITRSAPGTGVQLFCSEKTIAPEQNILFKCYERFGCATGFYPDITISLQKNIPMGAGLGGGSSDAAALLQYLNEQAGASCLNDVDLNRLACDLGADVPFFLLNRPAWATGRGDQLTPVHFPLHDMTMVLACPHLHVATAWAYNAWDEIYLAKTSPYSPLTPEDALDMVSALSNFVFYNSFEVPVFARHPQLRSVKEILLASGAAGAVMSGSGASQFAVFREPFQAEQAVRRLRERDIPTHVFPLNPRISES